MKMPTAIIIGCCMLATVLSYPTHDVINTAPEPEVSHQMSQQQDTMQQTQDSSTGQTYAEQLLRDMAALQQQQSHHQQTSHVQQGQGQEPLSYADSLLPSIATASGQQQQQQSLREKDLIAMKETTQLPPTYYDEVQQSVNSGGAVPHDTYYDEIHQTANSGAIIDDQTMMTMMGYDQTHNPSSNPGTSSTSLGYDQTIAPSQQQPGGDGIIINNSSPSVYEKTYVDDWAQPSDAAATAGSSVVNQEYVDYPTQQVDQYLSNHPEQYVNEGLGSLQEQIEATQGIVNDFLNQPQSQSQSQTQTINVAETQELVDDVLGNLQNQVQQTQHQLTEYVGGLEKTINETKTQLNAYVNVNVSDRNSTDGSYYGSTGSESYAHHSEDVPATTSYGATEYAGHVGDVTYVGSTQTNAVGYNNTDTVGSSYMMTSSAPQTTTPTPAPYLSTTELTLDICSDCVVSHGVGYAPLAGRCDAYIQCVYHGGVATAVTVHTCGGGTWWNQRNLVCDFPENVNCVQDNTPCTDRRPVTFDPTLYEQFTGSDWVKVACSQGQGYSDVTCSCSLAMPTPQAAEPNTSTQSPELACLDRNLKPIADDVTGYLQLAGSDWVRMPCPAGLVFDPVNCYCDWPTLSYSETSNDVTISHDVTHDVSPTCEPTLQISFSGGDVTDSSPNHFWVNNTGVKIVNGQGHFDGNSELIVPGLSNMDMGDTLCIFIKYRRAASTQSLQSPMSLVSNGCCGVSQSVSVCSGSRDVYFYAQTDNQTAPAEVKVIEDQGEWQLAKLVLTNGVLAGYTNTGEDTAVAQGSLTRRHRGLVVGAGGDCGGFVGVMDEVSVYRCIPGPM